MDLEMVGRKIGSLLVMFLAFYLGYQIFKPKPNEAN